MAAQRGAALLVSLILLVVITLVGLAAIGTTILQNRMAANQYDRQIAFQATEGALSVADAAITGNPSITFTTPAPAGIEDCSTPAGTTTPTHVCQADPFSDPNLATGGGTISNVTTAQFNPGSLAAAQPQYVIQYLGCFAGPQQKIRNPNPAAPPNPPDTYYFYRITARSGDPTTIVNRAVVTLQSMFRNTSCAP